ncbi:MAG: UDP-3-O-[3-hydroxymyristoyl] glucosamine N-acyltransferase [Myxococcota bacterium]|jgi:UDP-3-O-[3-hydroxymyristoyl] glucosamine N-acyltransferase
MINQNFFNKKQEFFTIAQILKITNSKLKADVKIDLEKKIYNVATIENATQDEISFFHSAAYLQKFLDSKAGFCFMSEQYADKAPDSMIAIVNPNPYFAYGKFLSEFFNDTNSSILSEEEQISSKATISKTAKIGQGVVIKSGAVIGDNVQIGKNSFIGANSVISANCQIGENVLINSLVAISHSIIGNDVIIHNGAKIGQDGFGFAHEAGKMQKILQLGIVEIHDQAEIGAGSCVDRGAITNTVIGKQVKIDNMVQIAHNVVIGEGTVIAGCAAVAGSTKIGKFVQVGGGSNISGHLQIGDGAKVAGMSGVVKSIAPMQSVGGLPALPIKDWHRMTIKMMRMIKNKS